MLGLVARADQRGIGILTAEFHRAMKPDKVLVVSHGQWPQDFGQYRDGWSAVSDLNLTDLSLDEQACRSFLEGLDVAYCVETLYDWRFKQWAEDAGCRVVIHGMPELYSTRDHQQGRPQPDEWLWPTPWLTDDPMTDLPEGEILPVPTIEREHTAADPDDDVLRLVHVAGSRAVGDRNGTGELMEAVRYIRQRVEVTIYTQEAALPFGWAIVTPNNVTVRVVVKGVADRWSMYEGHHALIMPRRYGGLCLPALEAQACGLTVVLPDVSPNEIWPGPRIATQGTKGQLVPYGYVPSAIISPRAIAKTVDTLAAQREGLSVDMALARVWAEQNQWARWKPEYQRVLS